MAYDERLAERIRHVLGEEPGLTERTMFGGRAFLVAGRMAAAAGSEGGMLLRVDPTETDTLVSAAHVDRFVMRGRALDGWLDVGARAIGTDADLRAWVARGVAYARSLPPR